MGPDVVMKTVNFTENRGREAERTGGLIDATDEGSGSFPHGGMVRSKSPRAHTSSQSFVDDGAGEILCSEAGGAKEKA